MTIAAIYARYSSDSQREESIEIQVEACTRLIESHGWERGEIYTDYALSGTNDKRPGFQRCIADGEAGLYNVLVIYKNDRFARNVVISKQYKQRLRDAGVSIWSVREGEQKDNPDSYLHETMDEAFAEYYSRNLSVLIRQGNQKNAEQLKASGQRIYGYDVDETDHFVINEANAAVVREMFERKARSQSIKEIVDWVNSEGHLTIRGKPFRVATVSKMLRNRSYMGTYSYAGHVVEDGIPAIVDKGLFVKVQDELNSNKRKKRDRHTRDYFLTGKVHCLKCDNGMVGQSGVGKMGKRYNYYVCRECGFRVPAEQLEDAIMDNIRETMLSDGSVEAMARSLDEYVKDELASSKWRILKDEKAELVRERDRLAQSIAKGVDPETVKDAINGTQRRIETLDIAIARERFYADRMSTGEDLVAFVRQAIEKSRLRPDLAASLFTEVIEKVYVDDECAYLVFAVGNVDCNISAEQIEAIKQANPSIDGVCINQLWWSRVDVMRTMFCNGQLFVLVIPL